jgi:hypothetical protein
MEIPEAARARPGTPFPPMPDPPEGFIIRIAPTKVRGMGPWGTVLG